MRFSPLFILLSAIVVTGMFVLPSAAHAVSISIFQPFGGKVLTSFVPGVVCPGEGPVYIKPAGLAPAGPYAADFSVSRYLYKTLLPGSWVIGLYLPTPVPICATTSIPPVPVPVLKIIMFGSSLPSL